MMKHFIYKISEIRYRLNNIFLFYIITFTFYKCHLSANCKEFKIAATITPTITFNDRISMTTYNISHRCILQRSNLYIFQIPLLSRSTNYYYFLFSFDVTLRQSYLYFATYCTWFIIFLSSLKINEFPQKQRTNQTAFD